jgi:cell division septal protein FtsQ
MPSKKKNIFKRPGFRLGMIASSIMLVLVLICTLFWFTTRSLFSANDHFILKRVVAKSGGWWKSKEPEICSILKISEGKTNLFSLDMAAEKKLLEQEPSIQKATVYKILPDTLVVEITERIPKAFLHWKGNKIVVDSDCIVMQTSSCINVAKDIPVITGFRSKPEDLLPGNTLDQVKPAIHLIKKVSNECPGIGLRRISLTNPKEFNTTIFDPFTDKIYQVFLPKNNLSEKLTALNSVLAAIAAGRGKNTKVIDLRFKGQAVLK